MIDRGGVFNDSLYFELLLSPIIVMSLMLCSWWNWHFARVDMRCCSSQVL